MLTQQTPPTPTQPPVSDVQPPQPYDASSPTNRGDATKISSPKYWLTILGIAAVYAVLNALDQKISKVWILPMYALFISGLVFCWLAVSQLKKTNQDVLTNEQKFKMVLLMSMSPILGQAFYYYRLERTSPQVAKISLSIGWKAFLFWLISATILLNLLLPIL